MKTTHTRLLLFFQQYNAYCDRQFQPLLEEMDLTMREVNVLLFLANNPDYDTARDITVLRGISKSQVSQAVLDEEKKIMMAQMAADPKMANKPEQVIEKIVVGKLNKFYAENCLLQQEFVKDNQFTVEKYIASAAKALGGSVKFVDAIRFEKGEGIEKKVDDFAEEVRKQAGL